MIPEMAAHLWQSTLFAGIAFLLALALRRNPAQVRYWVWFAASAKFLIPFSLLVGLGSVAPRQAAPAAPARWIVTAEQIGQPLVTFPVIAVPSGQPRRRTPVVAALVLWAVGFAVIALCWAVRWRRVLKLRRSAWPARSVGRGDFPVPVLSSPGLVEPGVFGIFRPVLLLPEGIEHHLKPAQMAAILAHEQCHVRRRDNLTAAIHMAAQAVFWFHPLVWWLGARLVEERERACDEEVVRLGSEPRIYAQSILKVCQHYLESPAVCVAGVSGANLRRRIERIMSRRIAHNLTGGMKWLLAGAAILACTVPLLVGMLHPARLHAQPAQESARQGQTIMGTWQGTLKLGERERRLVFKISLDRNQLKAVMYNIDQGGQATPASAIAREGSSVKMTLAAIGASFEGRLTPDANAIQGTWTQRSPVPLNLARATPESAWAIPDLPKPMSSDTTPIFEVSTIKPSQFAEGVRIGVSPGGLFTARGASLSQLIKFAYDLHPRQIIGGPAWLEKDKYDLSGKPDKPGMPNAEQLKGMLQKLLADRFQLAFHREKKELPVYAITLAKSGAKLTKDDTDPNDRYGFRIGQGSFSFHNATMAELASVLMASIMDRPVVDQTNLGSVRYDFMMTWTPLAPQPQLANREPNAPPSAGNADAPPDLFTAFQQQLGLKLESARAPVDVLVIDRVEKPSAN